MISRFWLNSRAQILEKVKSHHLAQSELPNTHLSSEFCAILFGLGGCLNLFGLEFAKTIP